MASLTIVVPDDLRDFVDRRIKEAPHASPTDYISALIREDQNRSNREQLEKRLLEGLDSGEPVPIENLDAYFAQKKKSLLARVQQAARP
jgi:antitoxin ParD1/3/4